MRELARQALGIALLSLLVGAAPLPAGAAERTEPCQDWRNRHPEWIWCDDFESDRLASYFEYDIRHGRFVRETGIGVNGSAGMRAEYLPGDPHGGFLHVAFGKTPMAYMKPVDAGTTRYTDIYWRFDLRL